MMLTNDLAFIKGDTLGHYFAECDSVIQFWKFLKRWFIRTFEFVMNFS